jgi:hypothetical protein
MRTDGKGDALPNGAPTDPRQTSSWKEPARRSRCGRLAGTLREPAVRRTLTTLGMAVALSGCGGTKRSSGAAVTCTSTPQAVVLASLPDVVVQYLVTDGEYVYWSDGSNINRVSVNGGAVATVTAATNTEAGGAAMSVPLAVDATYVYFVSGPEVIRVSKDGSARTVLASDPSGDLEIGISASAGYVYWLSVSSSTNVGSLLEVPIQGGPVTTVASGLPNWLWVVDTNNLYEAAITGETLSRVPLDGAAPATLATQQPGVAGIALDPSNIYWTSDSVVCTDTGSLPSCPDAGPTSATLSRVPIAGGAPVVLGNGYAAGGVTVDTSYAYWLDPYTSLNAVPVGGGSKVVITTEAAYLGPASDECNLFWVSDDTSATTATSVIKKMSKLGL